ncbi:MAG: hypothetical protein ACUZ8O_17445 [Candidatus Anammoxibacter sp.]
MKQIEKECTDEEMEYIDMLLEILRSDDGKSRQALIIMMNQITRKST